MHNLEVINILKNDLNFSEYSLIKLEKFVAFLLKYNKRYNLIAKSTEKSVWTRHVLDAAQILRFLDADRKLVLADLGTGAGFPGVILSIFDKKNNFHVKLYEKSSVKRIFLNQVKLMLNLKYQVLGDVYTENLDADIILCRAFKKLNEIIKISREKMKKDHKIIILKGKNAELEINKLSLSVNYSYKLERSITDNESKIIIVKVNKNEK